MLIFKKLISFILITTMLFCLSACSSSNTITDSNNIESSEIEESFLPPENDFDIDAYQKLIEESRQLIHETAILISNMGKYEHNYWQALNKIGGSMDYSSMVDGAFEWLLDKGNVSRTEVEQNYTTIRNQYKEIVQIDIGTNSTASTIKTEYNNLYTAFDSFYNLVTDPSGDINSFADSFNTYTDTIESCNRKLELLTQNTSNDTNASKTGDTTQSIPNIDTSTPFSVDAGFYEDDGYIYFSFIIKNNTDDKYLEYPSINVSLRDADGKLIISEQAYTSKANPGDVLAYNGVTKNNTEKPATTIECIITNQESDYQQIESKSTPANDLFEVSNVSVTSGSALTDITGEVKNNSGQDSGEVAVCVIFYKNNVIVRGETEYLNNIPKDASLPFTMSILPDSLPDYDNIIAIVQYQ